MVQMPEAATVGVLQKKVFFLNFTKCTGNSCARENTYEFAKFLRTCFLQNNPGQLLLKAVLQ